MSDVKRDAANFVKKYKNKFGYTLLHIAVGMNDFSRVEYLISLGAYVNEINGFCKTPLLQAAVRSVNDSYYRTIEILLKNGADVHTADNHGKTALHYLVQKANIKTVQLILNYNANVNLTDKRGNTPLFDAVNNNKNYEVVQLLISCGLDVNIVSSFNGSTALHKACLLEDNIKVVKFLLKNDAYVNVVDFNKRTPLMSMLNCKIQSEKILIFMLDYSDINIIDSNDKNVLNFDNDPNIWKIILEHTAKLQALDIPVDSSIIRTISNRSEYNNYFSKCAKELSMLKTRKLRNSWVTFFNLLVDNKKKQKNYAGNEDLIDDFNNSDYLNDCPIYRDRILKNVNKGIQKRKLYDMSAIYLYECLKIFNPTHLIIRDVLDCLNIKDLSIFCNI